MLSLGLSEPLSQLVQRKFQAAEAEKTLVFSSTQLAIVYAAGIPFQLRYCPALSEKPIQAKHPYDRPEHARKPDPFEDPDDLLIARVPADQPSHTLVLNKYPVIPCHFILATVPYKNQADLLEADDLWMAYTTIKSWEETDATTNHPGRLLCFFNSGPYSGASQSHRHMQFLPIECMRSSVQDKHWAPLIDLLSCKGTEESSQLLPFTHFCSAIPSNSTPSDILAMYHSIYALAKDAEREFFSRQLAREQDPGVPFATVSYNLAMTSTFMAVCPRTSEGASLSRDIIEGDVGLVDFNGTMLAGTLMVKTKKDWDTLREDDSKLQDLLNAVGVPRSAKHNGDVSHV